MRTPTVREREKESKKRGEHKYVGVALLEPNRDYLLVCCSDSPAAYYIT